MSYLIFNFQYILLLLLLHVLICQELDCMKHARFLLKFCPNKPSTCSLEPQYLIDLKSRLYSPEYSISQNPWVSDLEMRKACWDEILEETVRASCSQVTDRLRRVVKAKGGYIGN